MYWDRYIHRDNPRRIEPLDKPLDMYVMLDTETTGLHPEEGATLIEIGAFLVQPGNENSRPKFEQLIDPRQPLSEFTKEMSWELNPQKRHHRVTDLIADYHIGDVEEHRALADAIQEQMIYRALCHEATMRGKWIGQ